MSRKVKRPPLLFWINVPSFRLFKTLKPRPIRSVARQPCQTAARNRWPGERNQSQIAALRAMLIPLTRQGEPLWIAAALLLVWPPD